MTAALTRRLPLSLAVLGALALACGVSRGPEPQSRDTSAASGGDDASAGDAQAAEDPFGGHNDRNGFPVPDNPPAASRDGCGTECDGPFWPDCSREGWVEGDAVPALPAHKLTRDAVVYHVDDPCDTGELGICAAGHVTCGGMTARMPGWCQPDAFPVDEICDGLDNDCDGETDEGLADPETGCCPSGTLDLCDGRDNDCDGEIDEDAYEFCGPAGFCAQDGCVFPCASGECRRGERCEEVNDGEHNGQFCVRTCSFVECPQGEICVDDGECWRP